MGPIALLLIALAGWMLWTGRLQRMSGKDGLMLAFAILGAVMTVRGKPLIGLIPILSSVAYVALRKHDLSRKEDRRAEENYDVAEARALLGLPEHADDDAIRAAHRRLIATVHPDKGGTQALAAKINAARDVLLQHNAITHMHKK